MCVPSALRSAKERKAAEFAKRARIVFCNSSSSESTAMILHGDPYHWTLALRSLCCYGIPTPAIAEAKCTTPRVSSSYPATNYCMPLARHPRLRVGSRCDPLSDADASSLDRFLWNCRTRISQCCLRGFRFWRCAQRSDDVGRPSRFECINCILHDCIAPFL